MSGFTLKCLIVKLIVLTKFGTSEFYVNQNWLIMDKSISIEKLAEMSCVHNTI